jgi:hypothetical protein
LEDDVYAFEGEERFWGYACPKDVGGHAVFNRRCPTCGRWTKPPKTITFTETIEGTGPDDCIADCKKCGKVKLEFEGLF